MSRTSWYFSQNFPKGYSTCLVQRRVLATRVGMHSRSRREARPPYVTEPLVYCRENKPHHDITLSQLKPSLYCSQMLQPVGSRFWLRGYGPLPPFTPHSWELSLKALKCNTRPCFSLLSCVWLVSSGLWLARPLARQCSGPVLPISFSKVIRVIKTSLLSKTDQNMLLLEWSHGLSVVRSLLILSSVKILTRFLVSGCQEPGWTSDLFYLCFWVRDIKCSWHDSTL